MTEGCTLLDDYSGLKNHAIQTKAQLDAEESDNIRLALQKYLGRKRNRFPDWFSVTNINSVHRKMFGNVWNWAGKYRHSVKNIGVPPAKISTEMYVLVKDLEYWASLWEPLEIAVRTHHRLAWIHPYENGNGRHARFMGDMILHALGFSYPMWPTLSLDGHERRDYLYAIKRADHGDFTLLTDYFRKWGGGVAVKLN